MSEIEIGKDKVTAYVNNDKELKELKATVAAQATQIVFLEQMMTMHREMLEDLSRQVDSKI